MTQFDGMRGWNTKDIGRESVPLLWSTVRETASAEGFCCNMGDTNYPYVCGRKNCPEGVYTARRSERLAGDESKKKL